MGLCTSAKTVLHTLNTIWKHPDPMPTQTRFPFSFPLPSYMRSTNTPLPPSYATAMPGLAAECRYTIRVDMYRKGLRRHEKCVSCQSHSCHRVLIRSFSVKAMVLYLPRTMPPAPPIPRNPSPPSTPIDEADIIKWKTIEIPPTVDASPSPPSTNKEYDSISSLSETVDPKYIIKFTLPEPLVYASASTIPFTLKLRGDSPVVPRLFNDLDVFIIKKTVVFSGAYFGVRDGVIGTAELHQVDDEPPESTAKGEEAVGWKVFRGSVTSVREGGETSWEVPGLINMKVRYCRRCITLLLNPFSIVLVLESGLLPQIEPSTPTMVNDLYPILSRNGLIYLPIESIKMVTHPRLPHQQYIHDPVLGLIPVPGSSGTPIRRG